MIPPETGQKQDKDRENFQAANHHQPNEEKLCLRCEVGVGVLGPYCSQARTNIVECGRNTRGTVDQFMVHVLDAGAPPNPGGIGFSRD